MKIEQFHKSQNAPAHNPHCSIQNRNVHISVLNGALWDTEQVHSVICELGHFWIYLFSAIIWSTNCLPPSWTKLSADEVMAKFASRYQWKDVQKHIVWHIAAETHCRHLHTTFSNAFSWMKLYKFRLTFHWSLFPRVQSTIFQHWFR